MSLDSSTSSYEPALGLDEIPKRFIDGCEGDMKEARRRWDITRQWRETEGVNNVLKEPQPYFDAIKSMYPHYHCGRGKEGHVVYYERPGEFVISKLLAQGCSIDDMVRHWLFVTEYQWEVLCKGDQSAKGITVMDMNGIKLTDVAGDNLSFLKKTISYANQHYPERSHLIFMINAPYYFSLMWKIVRPMVHVNTQRKVKILTAKETLAGLQEHIDISQIPVFYGGECDFGGKDSCRFSSPEAIALAEYAKALNDKANEAKCSADGTDDDQLKTCDATTVDEDEKAPTSSSDTPDVDSIILDASVKEEQPAELVPPLES